MSDSPFAQKDGGTVTVSASTSSADEAISSGAHWLRVVNATANTAFIKTAQGSALTATAADFPVAAGATAVMKMSPTHNICAVILSSGTGSVYVTPGQAVR